MFDRIDPLGSDEVQRALAFARARERYAGTRRDDLLSCCEAAWEAAVSAGWAGDPIDRFERSMNLIAWTRGWTRGPVDMRDLDGQSIPLSVLRPFMLSGRELDQLERVSSPRAVPAHSEPSRPRLPRVPFLSPVPVASALAAGMIGIAVMGQSGGLPSVSTSPSSDAGGADPDANAHGSGALPVDGVQTASGGGAKAGRAGSGGGWSSHDASSHVAGLASDVAGATGSGSADGGGPMPHLDVAPPAAAPAPRVTATGGSAAPARTIPVVGAPPPSPPVPARPAPERPVTPPQVHVPDVDADGPSSHDHGDGSQDDQSGDNEGTPSTGDLTDALPKVSPPHVGGDDGSIPAPVGGKPPTPPTPAPTQTPTSAPAPQQGQPGQQGATGTPAPAQGPPQAPPAQAPATTPPPAAQQPPAPPKPPAPPAPPQAPAAP